MRTPLVSDQELLKQYLSGSEPAFERLMIRHKDKVYTSIYMMVKDSYLAEDIFQETFIKVIDTLRSGKYNDEGKFIQWVMRIAYNMCIDYFRKVKRNPSIVTSDGDDIFKYLKFEETPADLHEEVMQGENKLKDIINLLPEEQKEVVMLRHYFDFSFKEIAEYTDVSINTSLGRMRYALINLRKLIEKHQLDVVRITM
jgi:RNA polymerase sigma-70 factor (ECF subfamily)